VTKLDEELEGKRPGDMLSSTTSSPPGGERAGEEVAFQVMVKEDQAQGPDRGHRRVGSRGQRVRPLDSSGPTFRTRMESVRRSRPPGGAGKVLQAVGQGGPSTSRSRSVQEEDGAPPPQLIHRLEEHVGATRVEQYLMARAHQDQLIADVRLEATKAVKGRPACGAVVRRRASSPTTPSRGRK